MLSLTIWWVGILLVTCVLVRSFRIGTLKIYSFFYAYAAGVVASQLTLYLIYTKYPAAYSTWFWRVEFPTLILGCGIILEIFKHVLSPYPGAERLARVGGLFVFGAIFCFVVLYPRFTYGGSLARSMEDLERDLRTVQAIFLFGIIGVIAYYRLPLGKNIKGMIIGYALYIATCLTSLAMGSYSSDAAHAIWKEVQPLSYDVSLTIWLVALWSYHPNPAPESALELGADYETFASRTRHAVDGMRSYLTRAARS